MRQEGGRAPEASEGASLTLCIRLPPFPEFTSLSDLLRSCSKRPDHGPQADPLVFPRTRPSPSIPEVPGAQTPSSARTR